MLVKILKLSVWNSQVILKYIHQKLELHWKLLQVQVAKNQVELSTMVGENFGITCLKWLKIALKFAHHYWWKYWNGLSKIAIKSHLKIYPPLLGDHASAGMWSLKTLNMQDKMECDWFKPSKNEVIFFRWFKNIQLQNSQKKINLKSNSRNKNNRVFDTIECIQNEKKSQNTGI